MISGIPPTTYKNIMIDSITDSYSSAITGQDSIKNMTVRFKGLSASFVCLGDENIRSRIRQHYDKHEPIDVTASAHTNLIQDVQPANHNG